MDLHQPVDLTNKVILQITVFYIFKQYLSLLSLIYYFFLEFGQPNPRRKMEVR